MNYEFFQQIRHNEECLRVWTGMSPNEDTTASEIKEATEFFKNQLNKLNTIANS